MQIFQSEDQIETGETTHYFIWKYVLLVSTLAWENKRVFAEVKATDLFNDTYRLNPGNKSDVFLFWGMNKKPKHCNAIIAQVSINRRTKSTISSLTDYT